jgi:hypothetical protein
MIKLIKIGNLIYRNIEPKVLVPVQFNEEGFPVKYKEKWVIPNDVKELKFCILDTLGWLVDQKIQRILGSVDKKEASTSKGIVLLAKIISLLNPDTSNLTEDELMAYNLMLKLADMGYSDSSLLVQALNAVLECLSWYKKKIDELNRIDLNSDTALED